MTEKKTYRQVLRETFTKTLGERYDESPKVGKIVYWIFFAFVIAFICGALLIGHF